MFESIEEKIENYTQIKLINTNTGEYLAILPQLGAAISALKLNKDGKLYDLIDGFSNSENTAHDCIKHYYGMVLYPFPNRIANGKYTFEGINYQLPINDTDFGNAIHGLVSQANFTIKKINLENNKASIELYYELLGDNRGFPFKSKLTIIFTITNQSEMTCCAIVESMDTKNQPIGIGWHPYFKISDCIDDLYLKIDSAKIIEANDNMIPTGEYKNNYFEESHNIGDTFLDTGYEIKTKDGLSVTQLYDKLQKITLNIWQQTGAEKYNYLQVYTAKNRKSIAIEPMTCAVDAFNNGLGLITLKPNSTFETVFGVRLT